MKILLVEDERGLAESIRRGLVAQNILADLAADGITGLWMGRENPYDVIVLDIMLPGRNGYDVLKLLREAGVWAPVLMLTAKDGEYDQTDAFDLGADDYLTKPFSFPVFVARLRALARRGSPERPVNLVMGGLELDPSRGRVTCGGEALTLTAKQFALLDYLMRHPEDIVSKSDILDNVWDSAYEGSDNIVEVYVGRLRRKLANPTAGVSLETIRGMGYRLHTTGTRAADSRCT